MVLLGSKKHTLLAALVGVLVLVTSALVNTPAASAHIERPSYWPSPGPDCSISPCAGGAVPTARTLASALTPSANSTTRVVCQPDSLTRLQASIAAPGQRLLRPSHRSRGVVRARRRRSC